MWHWDQSLSEDHKRAVTCPQSHSLCMTRSPQGCCYSSQDSIRSASTSQCRLACNCPHHVLQLRKVHTVSSLPCLFLYLSLLSSITCPRGPYPSLCPQWEDTPSIVHFSLSTRSWSPCQEFTPCIPPPEELTTSQCSLWWHQPLRRQKGVPFSCASVHVPSLCPS